MQASLYLKSRRSYLRSKECSYVVPSETSLAQALRLLRCPRDIPRLTDLLAPPLWPRSFTWRRGILRPEHAMLPAVRPSRPPAQQPKLDRTVSAQPAAGKAGFMIDRSRPSQRAYKPRRTLSGRRRRLDGHFNALHRVSILESTAGTFAS